MKTKADYMAANRELATLLGWTKIVDAGGALLGTPTWVCDNSRSQVQVPDWCGQWSAGGVLLSEFGVGLQFEIDHVTASVGSAPLAWSESFSDHVTRQHAVRFAIVTVAAIALEASQQART